MKAYFLIRQRPLLLNQYQLKKISSFFFIIAQLLIGALAAQALQNTHQGKLDFATTSLVILYIISSLFFFAIATLIAGKVKDKYA